MPLQQNPVAKSPVFVVIKMHTPVMKRCNPAHETNTKPMLRFRISQIVSRITGSSSGILYYHHFFNSSILFFNQKRTPHQFPDRVLPLFTHIISSEHTLSSQVLLLQE